MDIKKVLKFLYCMFTLVFVCNVTLAAGMTWAKFSYEPKLYEGKTCAQSDIIFQTHDIYEEFSCGKMCFLNEKCLHVIYQSDVHACLGCQDRPYVAWNASDPDDSQRLHFSDKSSHFDCLGILEANPLAKSGVYEIANSLKVYCDMTTTGGGWTVIHNRLNGSGLDFNRSFDEFEHGFGDVKGEFWLGLKNIQKITITPHNLFLDVTDVGGSWNESYVDFQLFDGIQYAIYIDVPTRGTVKGDRMYSYYGHLKGVPFSTFDRDKDLHDNLNCAIERGACWCTYCAGQHQQNINGIYCDPEESCNLPELPGHFYGTRLGRIKRSRVMIRRMGI